MTGIQTEYPDHKFIGEEDTAEAKGGSVPPLTGNIRFKATDHSVQFFLTKSAIAYLSTDRY